jgi:hypothetical protein
MGVTVMASGKKPYVFPPEHREFFEDFQNLIKKHPQAASRFVLADLGDSAKMPVALSSPGSPETVWECTLTEWGFECTHSHLE